MKNINCHLSVTLLILTLWAFFVPEAHGAAPLYAPQEPDTILRELPELTVKIHRFILICQM